MSMPQTYSGMQLPTSLQTQLHDFRRRVWTIKTIEAVCGAIFGVLVSYLAVFGLDRLVDTPVGVRWGIFIVAVIGCAAVPVLLHRWIWCHRRSEQLARLISRKYPSIGDQMLGIIELVRNEFEQARSRALCEAAIRQVADAASRRDFSDAVPNPRHRLWACLAAAPVVGAIALFALFPAAAENAWARFIAPWRPVERYTFTAVEALPEQVVVPHGEQATITARLRAGSEWRPAEGTVQLGAQVPVTAKLVDDKYEFTLPAQIDEEWLTLRIGDARQTVRLVPMLRPELASIVAEVRLPDYLLRPAPLHRDIRGGSISLVTGSEATFTVTANRGLSSALVDGQPRPANGTSVSSAPIQVDGERKLVFRWEDAFGLAGAEPFAISIHAREDEPPSLACEDLPRIKVLLISETLNFKLRASDDFGIRRIGMEWQGADPSAAEKLAHGERVLAAGGPEKESLDLAGTFNAELLGIEPQPVNMRLFVEDYLPGRERVYSPTYLFYVLSNEEHFIWVTEQLNKWHRQSLEVRDREMQLHSTNQQLRLLAPEELDRPETRRMVEAQSAAERANGRRLNGLVGNGEELIRQAMRNPEFGVGHLDKWADMLQIMKDIAGNRMPNVADLLKQSAQSPGAMAENKAQRSPIAGNQQTQPAGGQSKPSESPPKPPVPKVVDNESTQQPPSKEDKPDEPTPSKSGGRLTLPVTTVAGSGGKKPPAKTPAGEKLDEAVAAQQDLLAEFDKIAEELNKVLANLEGSTLLKRLKAASRQQYVVAGKIGDQLAGTFGQRNRAPAEARKALGDLEGVEQKSSQDISMIMDDMQSYFDRRRLQRFKTVLDEMRELDAVGSLRQLGHDVSTEAGMSIAQCEYWSDTFDRWADNLLDPACSGKCPGGKSKASLPPSVVLEAMQILEGEVHLREETRGAEQAKPAISQDEYGQRANKLRDVQAALSDRVGKLTTRIRELPDGEQEFAPEIKLLGRVELVMDEATDLLALLNTGSQTIGAETEAIELLLQSKRINPRGGGGGGSSPGGGGTGTTHDSALALIGSGLNEKEVREDRGITQTTGESGSTLPEEFRAGLDEYFNQLEKESSK